MKNSFTTEAAKTLMAMNDLDLFPNYNISENREEREDSWKCGLAVDDKERNVVDLESICKISDTCSTFVCMSDDDDFVATIDQFL